jgi:dynein heavy chain
MAGIFQGLSASGSWGCFDELNILKPEVLSVCATQFKSVLDAIKAGKSRFVLQGEEIALDPTCGAFITMNPGYIGRAELPQDLKALFRPITVVVPDLAMICENMLMAEGFISAEVLSKKFVTLYLLCKDLLSKQPHYDWGMRAIKSVLVVAGNMKRAEKVYGEDAVLMRALRDFNLPKFVADDLPIFYGLLGDLFPGIDPPRARDMDFEAIIREVTIEAGLEPDEMFLRKVVELGELQVIRHCVFTMGPPGAGKSSSWKMLQKANDKVGKKTTLVDLNPKVINSDELYGAINMATREWKDGILSNKMRALSDLPDENPKWLIFDGDLDATWIESMNSVMDDNKLLTLASNERIQLKAHMRMFFEIRDLNYATPATVSRAGILYISDSDGYQWRAFVKSWVRKQNCNAEMKEELQSLFDKYMPETLKHVKTYFKHAIPQRELAMINAMCSLLQSIISTNEIKALEYVFVFSAIWCVGGGFTVMSDGKDYRKEFSKWWMDKFKAIKFPGKTVFDYYIDIENSKVDEWIKLANMDIVNTIDTSKSIQSYTIPTVDTISCSYLMRQFMSVGHSPLLVGQAGCGKTQMIKGLLKELVEKTDDYLSQVINMNYYTDATTLRLNLMGQLEKQGGTRYGPVGKYTLIYFIDDLNMP